MLSTSAYPYYLYLWSPCKRLLMILGSISSTYYHYLNSLTYLYTGLLSTALTYSPYIWSLSGAYAWYHIP
jgi:hypothetical protein